MSLRKSGSPLSELVCSVSRVNHFRKSTETLFFFKSVCAHFGDPSPITSKGTRLSVSSHFLQILLGRTSFDVFLHRVCLRHRCMKFAVPNG